MKTLVLVAYLLAVSLAGDPIEVKRFNENYQKCFEEANEPLPEKRKDKAVLCLVQKQHLVNTEGVLVLEKQLELAENIISDSAKLNQAKEIIIKCTTEGYQGPGSKQEKLRKSSICAKDVLKLVDKS